MEVNNHERAHRNGNDIGRSKVIIGDEGRNGDKFRRRQRKRVLRWLLSFTRFRLRNLSPFLPSSPIIVTVYISAPYGVIPEYFHYDNFKNNILLSSSLIKKISKNKKNKKIKIIKNIE
ncbi:hypothetical protein BpHYR1_031412 [Brachionus plicatilis]|uniref:Uncharacterized protein n=1 Tax=Brachionus plicatilis TaxID=10195 RepID=A0A3M7S737_BRAPC|nr:hypothetical protein BpHYR1_031412 [Brachionus plicatilis]